MQNTDFSAPGWQVLDQKQTPSGTLLKLQRQDSFGLIRQAQLRILPVCEANPEAARSQVEYLLTRAQKAQQLGRYSQLLGYEDYWVSGQPGNWNVCLQAPLYPTLREHLDQLARLDPVICLSADAQTARKQLEALKNRNLLPVETVIRQMHNLCLALQLCQKLTLTDCTVDDSSVYIDPQGQFLLGDLGCHAQDRPTGVPALGMLMLRLLSDASGNLRGDRALQELAQRCSQGKLSAPQLQQALEKQMTHRAVEKEPEKIPEKKVDKAPEKAPEKKSEKEPEKKALMLQLLSDTPGDRRGDWASQELEKQKSHKTPEKVPEKKTEKKPGNRPDSQTDMNQSGFSFGGDLLGSMVKKQPTPASKDLFDKIRACAISSATLASGYFHSVAVTNQGRVMAIGLTRNGQCIVMNWRGVTAVAAGARHTVALQSTGKVLAVGENVDGQCNVNSWRNIVQLTGGEEHTVGLDQSGRVLAVGNNSCGQCEVSLWKDMAAVAARGQFTVGLHRSGTLQVAGKIPRGTEDIFDWTDIIQVAAGPESIIALREDGTVLLASERKQMKDIVSQWRDIVAVAAGRNHVVGLHKNGTVLAAWDGKSGTDYGQCRTAGVSDVVAVACGEYHTLGLRRNGTVVSAGGNFYNECNVKTMQGICVPRLQP